MSDDPLVTICIPTWQSEGFIDGTLHQARNQTHGNLLISVSIDRSDDRTEEICRRHAEEDDRVVVFAHDRRVGWARNVNHLIDGVDSEFFFLFMHDDLIDVRYVETLLGRLREHPEAASAQCEVLHVVKPGKQYLSWGTTHDGPASDRVIAALLDPGAPLRALVRTGRLDPAARFGAVSQRGWQSHVPYHLAVLAAGPALHVPEILYWRRSGRPTGVESAWTDLDLSDLVADQRVNTERCLDLIGRIDATQSEKQMMRFAVYLAMMLPVRLRERHIQDPLIDPSEFSSAFEFDAVSADWSRLATRSRRTVAAAWVNLARVEAGLHLRRRSPGTAIRSLADVGVRPLSSGIALLVRRAWRRAMLRLRPRELPIDLVTWLAD